MKSRSAPGSSTPTWKRPETIRGLRVAPFGLLLLTLAAIYLIAAFAAPSPLLRIGLRTVPVLPLAVWTLWFDRTRPFERQPPLIRLAARIVVLVLAMAFAIAILGIGLNWLYDPARVI